MTGESPRVIVVGSGNAAMSAALAAAEHGARVTMLEKAPRDWVGGDSYFTAGAYRMTYGSLDEIRSIIEKPNQSDAAEIDPYSAEDFASDMRRITQDRCDQALTEALVSDATDGARWLAGHGVRWRLMFERQSHEVGGGRRRFWGNLPIGTVDGGRGLVEQELAAIQRAEIEIRFEAPVTGFVVDDGRIQGVVTGGRSAQEVEADAVVLCSGGFQADPRLRATYLGPGWDLALVRGTPFNTGEVMMMAIEAGVAPYGHWSGCHAIAWDANASPTGDRDLLNRPSRQGYPFGLVVNADAHRFVDEGADLRNYTYAKYGAEILRQPGARAYQLFDEGSIGLISRIDYEAPRTTRVEADTIEELARQLGLAPEALRATIDDYNASVQPGRFDPSRKDGKGTMGIEPPKSNWAQALDRPPFVAFPVTCGITFTFGGLRIDRDGRALGLDGRPVPGLFAAGEVVGGLFYHNYPGGSGLAAGTVFGRRAGRTAATPDQAQGDAQG